MSEDKALARKVFRPSDGGYCIIEPSSTPFEHLTPPIAKYAKQMREFNAELRAANEQARHAFRALEEFYQAYEEGRAVDLANGGNEP